MKRLCLFAVCFIIASCIVNESRAQGCVSSFVKLFAVENAKNVEVDASRSLNAGELSSLKLIIYNHTDADSYFLKELKIEVILARGTARVRTINFKKGIEEFNKFEALSGLIAEVAEGDRLIIDFKKELICGSFIMIPLSPISKEFYKPVYLSDIIAEAALAEGDSTLQYVGLNILPDYVSPRWMKEQLGVSLDSNGLIKVHKKISLTFCNFLYGRGTTLDSVSFTSLRINYSDNTNLQFDNCVFEDGFEIRNSQGNHAGFYNATFLKSFSVDNSKFEEFKIKNSSFLNSPPAETGNGGPDYSMIISGEFKKLAIDSARLVDKGINGSILITGEADIFKIVNSDIDAHLNLQRLKINSEFGIVGNQFSKNLFLGGIQVPEKGTEIYWSQLSGNKLGLIKLESVLQSEYGRGGEKFYLAIGDQNLKDEILFKRLLKSYQQLSDIYKINGDLESANGCYSEMKDLVGRRLEYQYRTEGGFQKYFRWKLNQLMKYYTDHGTDPARAIVVSIWVVIWFGIFYFFFPSDWDVTSKRKLMQNFQDFVQKNEKGYVMPFFILMGGFFVSLLNALTLSLNSFVTLGFGNIPTHGLARYVTILEGFIGWFLLSIFTVALINQVLG